MKSLDSDDYRSVNRSLRVTRAGKETEQEDSLTPTTPKQNNRVVVGSGMPGLPQKKTTQFFTIAVW